MSFETIEIDMDTDLQDSLVVSYIENHLSPASIDAFYSNYDADHKIEDQLFAAILNEVIINAIQSEIKKMKVDNEDEELC